MERIERIEDMSLAGQQAAYDAAAKRLLSSKKILAWILKYCVEEFRDSEISQTPPDIGKTPIDYNNTVPASPKDTWYEYFAVLPH